MDVYDFTKSEADICKILARTLEEGSWNAFYDYLKRLAGTHILFIEHKGLSVILDATGTVPATHGQFQGSRIVASHPRLIAQITDSPILDLVYEWDSHPKASAGGKYMPGLLTEFDGIEIITPNQRFDVEGGHMFRFYPDRELLELDPKDIAKTIAPLLAGQLEKLSKSYKPAFSLSGGLDTRVTLAASRSVSHTSLYFTYYSTGNKVLSNDNLIARNLAKQLGLNHVSFELSSRASSSLKRATAYYDGILRKKYLYDLNRDIYSNIGRGTIHVRSNILEIARGFYSKNPVNRPNKFDANKLSKLFRNSTKDEFAPYFDDFIQKTNFHQENLYNLHYSDIFYWEHRLGSYYGSAYREARTYFETYIIYNCRAVLEPMLSTNINNRINAVVMRHLIENMWPEVLQVPIFSGAKFIDLHMDRASLIRKPKRAARQPPKPLPLISRVKRLAKSVINRIRRGRRS